jgi:hypothetical protein
LPQSAAFSCAYKKLHKNQAVDVDVAEEVIGRSSEVGEHNCGDLCGEYDYKFKIKSQIMLLAYEYDPHPPMLLLLGSYENFYLDLKR